MAEEISQHTQQRSLGLGSRGVGALKLRWLGSDGVKVGEDLLAQQKRPPKPKPKGGQILHFRLKITEMHRQTRT